MTITILTLFPEMVQTVLTTSMLKRASDAGAVQFVVRNLRDWGTGSHQSVDDTPYGGGAGMVLKVDVIDRAIAEITHDTPMTRILMTPQGRPFSQATAESLVTQHNDILLIAGHYEGFDERVRQLVDMEISVGDAVVTGGELPALMVADAVTRLLPSALGSDESIKEESFSITGESGRLLEYPHYTRPERYTPTSRKLGELTVPEVIKSGDHAKIAAWRNQLARERTQQRRPDLLGSSD